MNLTIESLLITIFLYSDQLYCVVLKLKCLDTSLFARITTLVHLTK